MDEQGVERRSERFEGCDISVVVGWSITRGRYLAHLSIQKHSDAASETLDMPVPLYPQEFELQDDAFEAAFLVGRKLVNRGINWSSARPARAD